MANERLRNAMNIAHIDLDTLTRRTGVDPKTVQRWLNGRIPHARHRWKIAEILKEREDFLWPHDGNTPSPAIHTSEIVAAYAHRNQVPLDMWWRLFLNAQKNIDLLGYAMHFLPEQHSDLITLFREKATSGCKIRIALADPTCIAVTIRDEEEQLDGTLPALIQSTLYHFRGISGLAGIDLCYHTTNLYNSLFRGDNEMFVTPHLYALHGSRAPLLYLRSLSPDGLFANFASHFEAIWATAKPITKGENSDRR